MKEVKFFIGITLTLVIIAAIALLSARTSSSEAEPDNRLFLGELVEELQIIDAFIGNVFIEIYSIDGDSVSFHLFNNFEGQIAFSMSYLENHCEKDSVWREVWSIMTLNAISIEANSRIRNPITLRPHRHQRAGSLYRIRVPAWPSGDRSEEHDVVLEFYWDFD